MTRPGEPGPADAPPPRRNAPPADEAFPGSVPRPNGVHPAAPRTGQYADQWLPPRRRLEQRDLAPDGEPGAVREGGADRAGGHHDAASGPPAAGGPAERGSSTWSAGWLAADGLGGDGFADAAPAVPRPLNGTAAGYPPHQDGWAGSSRVPVEPVDPAGVDGRPGSSPLPVDPADPRWAGGRPDPLPGPVGPAGAGWMEGLDPPTEVLRRFVPAREVLDRESRDAPPPARADGGQAGHPPRAVVRRRRARRRMLEWPFLIVVALVAAFVIRTFLVQTFFIPSASMHETLLEGDRVLVNKISYHLHDVHRGDVIVFRRPPNFPVDDQDLIKRVVGLPGERVEAHGRQLFVDGHRLIEPYVAPACHGTDDFGPVTVPAHHLWVMGDNRCDSSDSRVFGPIDSGLVVGRAFVLVWPLSHLGWL